MGFACRLVSRKLTVARTFSPYANIAIYWRYGRERGKAHEGTGLSPNPGPSLGSAACSAASPALIRVRNNLQPGLAPGSQPHGEWPASGDHAPEYHAGGIFQVCPAMGVVHLPELNIFYPLRDIGKVSWLTGKSIRDNCLGTSSWVRTKPEQSQTGLGQKSSQPNERFEMPKYESMKQQIGMGAGHDSHLHWEVSPEEWTGVPSTLISETELTNCLTEICFDDAIDQARHLDNFQRTHGRLIGPLHGVPMSVKDQFNIKGLDSTLGYVCNAFTPAKSDALLVHTLKQLGAIIIAKTNLPQSIMWCETDNPLWGLTTHPTNSKLTPWGSSGGEAALLALV
ncbi:hypothetical protein G4B84_010508 [Aspergillus flavus NRRL3357]|nr:uncharacterized protein G4B84_010508 [Aspergillus flavus NRRL3357]QMW35017.1 hypothetical protein G4B84_010508 [Aspergillus flavus NRRL3357]